MHRRLVLLLLVAAQLASVAAGCNDRWSNKKCAKKHAKGKCECSTRSCKRTRRKCRSTCAVCGTLDNCGCDRYIRGASSDTRDEGVYLCILRYRVLFCMGFVDGM